MSSGPTKLMAISVIGLAILGMFGFATLGVLALKEVSKITAEDVGAVAGRVVRGFEKAKEE